MSAKQKKICNSVGIVLTLGAVVLYVLAMHDMQTAKGIGLYLSLKASSPDRRFWDFLTDGIRLLGLLVFAILPIVWTKKRSMVSISRQLLTILALMPLINETAVLHFLFEKGLSTVKIVANQGELILQGRTLFNNAVFILPVLLIFIMANGMKTGIKRSPFATRGIVGIELILLTITFFVPAFAPMTSACFWYILILIIMIEAEKLFATDERLEIAAGVLYLLFGLRAVYRMIFIMESFRV